MVLCIDKQTMQYYSMLHYALESWRKYYKNDYDVFISVSSPDFDIWNESYLGLNITKTFPNVFFYKSDFDKKKYDVYLQKWYDMDKVFSKGYESIFNFDVDSIFYGDLRYIFDKYNEDCIYSLREGYNEHFYKVLGEPGIPSGQLIIPKSAFNKVDNLFQKILDKRIELNNSAKEKLDDANYNWFKGLSEQYSAQKVFKENGVEYSLLALSDIGMGIEDFEVICVDNKIVYNLKNNKTVAGYMSANYHLFLPNEYMEENDIIRKNKHCAK
jgi:hypothetical protein